VIFSGETSKGLEVLQFSVSATKIQLPSSGDFCKLRYDTTPVKSVSANISFYANNSKIPNCQMSKMDNMHISVCVVFFY